MGSCQSKPAQEEIEIRTRTGSEFHPSTNQVYKAAKRIKFHEKLRKLLDEEDMKEFKLHEQRIRDKHERDESETPAGNSNQDGLSIVEQSVPVIELSLSE